MITPYDEKNFGGSASSRRNFIDRIVANFDQDHLVGLMNIINY